MQVQTFMLFVKDKFERLHYTWFSLYLQIQKVILALGDYMGATCHACIGGTNVRNEVQKLQAEAPHIVVGTPGRVYDMLNRKFLCEYSVLCEI